MKILIAPAAFKGSLRPTEAAQAIAQGLSEALPQAELIERPLADGGDGTLEVLLRALGGQVQKACVQDPLGREIEAEFGLLELDDQRVAVIEMAYAAGLVLLKPEERDPLRASTYGVGQLVRAALDAGAEEIWLGLGGSATVDGGAGFLQALGARLLDAQGGEIPGGSAGLAQLAAIDFSTLDPRLKRTELIALLDVLSPLLGEHGARLYMPQKGATPEMCDQLERNLAHWAEIAQQDLGMDVREVSGAGAAGGLGAALALLGAKLVSGSEFIAKKLGIDALVPECDLVIGSEGQVDEQTLEGKGILTLARLARQHAKPLIVLCGSRGSELKGLHQAGVTAVFSVVPGPVTLEDALQNAHSYVAATSYELGRLIQPLRFTSQSQSE
jgi:glycerate kinase